MVFPITRNPMLTTKAVKMDWWMTFFCSGFDISVVREAKIGRIPRALKATKSGIKGRKILKEINWFKT
jgi:hypothetical protein